MLIVWRVIYVPKIRLWDGNVGEFGFVDHLAQRLTPKRDDTRLAIGDDAALVECGGQSLAITTDTLIEGRHFPTNTAAFDVGYKALAVNCSDLAAMAAEPAWATVALTTPSIEADWCDAFIDGARAALDGAQVDLIGGDTTRGALSVTVSAIGTVDAKDATYRHAARPGDLIAVTGTVGDAAAGLACLDAADDVASANTTYLVQRLSRPEWRSGAVLAGIAHAAIDVSDGLLADLGHILSASGVGARVNADALPTSAALAAWIEQQISTRRRLQLTGGDDYELCLTLPADALNQARNALDCDLTPIGEIAAEPGLELADAEGRAIDAAAYGAAGWDHFGATHADTN